MASRMSAGERREAVLKAAIVEFSKGGLAGTSTEDIARRAEISQPYLFRLFGTKKELFLAAIERTFDRALAILVEAAGDLSGVEAKMAMADAYRMFLQDRTLLLTQMHAYAACGDDDVRSVTQTCFGKLWLTVAGITGLDDEELTAFFGYGMLLNMAAAMDLMAVIDLPWVRACLGEEIVAGTDHRASDVQPEIQPDGP
ncbi:TetR/AcrR family transcriptional regulator [Acidiferrimicrobium sp. IK]|uniref:TetR/AcrR family transcriptional regulator n=1 Tax=Acidiferrimicrobium sp. IK TaxID=2871700 RepID=UPI0021CB06E0|nr:TetR/AcrR family transcriptional regulator [Acidiferrimicrobium sp. IK]MCU4187160.1 TetR/AcrR family transcriptional regulator [Acidiferrimicrobium sp. IK]